MAKVTPERMFEVLGEKPEEFDKAVDKLYKRGNMYEIPTGNARNPTRRTRNRHEAERYLENILAQAAPADAEDGMSDDQRRVCRATMPGYTERAGNREFKGWGIAALALGAFAFLWSKGCMDFNQHYEKPTRPGIYQPVRPGTYQPVGPGNYGDRSQSPTPDQRHKNAQGAEAVIALGLAAGATALYLAGRKKDD